MKLTEFKKPKLNELDLSSFIGDYGSAGLRTGLGSFMGKNVLSTQDQMVKDQFVKNFTSRAYSGLQSGISSGLVDPTATGMTTSGAKIGTKFGNNPVTNPVTPPVTNPVTPPVTNPVTPPVTNPVTTPNTSTTPASSTNDAGSNAFGQMTNQLTSKKSPEQIRQEKQAAAAGVAQDQMSKNGQFSKLPTDQFNKTAANTRQQKQNAATQTAQDQMSPMSKLPTDQFNKTATTTRQNKQAGATQTAQDQMSPMSKLPTDQFNKSAANVRQKQQADAMKPVTKSSNNKVNFPNKKKKTNPGSQAFGQMAQNLGDKQSNFSEGTQFDKLNYLFENILNEISLGKALSPTGQVVGQSNQQQNKQSISQYITNFFKQFMKGVSISDPAVMTRLASLAKELEQTYSKDKGKSVLPKLAELGWSVQHAQAEEQPNNTPPNNTTTPNTTTPNTTTPSNPPSNPPPPPNTTTNNASGQKTKTAYQQIQGLLKDLTPANKQKILAALQKELAKDSELSIGGKKLDPNNPEDAKIIDMLKKQGKL